MIKKNRIKKLLIASFFGLSLAISIQQKYEVYAKGPEKSFINYEVKQGDCISSIAYKYKGIKKLSNMMAEIQYVNSINEVIYPGQILKIPSVQQ